MAKPGRKPGTPKTGGRVKGTPNKITATVKEAVEVAFDKLGGVAWLVRLGRDDPRAFAALLAKVMPNKIEADINVTSQELEERLQRGRDRVAAAAQAAAAQIEKEGTLH